MSSRKKWMAACLTTVFLLSGCSPIVKDVSQTTNIYTTFYPIYALTEQIAEGVENVEIHCLVQPQDVCLRSYDLSDWDLYLLGYSADAVLSAGNGLEGFEDKLHEIGESVLPVAEVLYGVPMEQFEDVASDEESHFSGENPHVYMSLSNAAVILDNIAGTLSILDSENADSYAANCISAQEKFEQIWADVEKQTEVCNGVTAAVMHEALLYPALECGLEIAAVFERESGEMLYGNSIEECLTELEEKKVQVVLLEQQAPRALIEVLTEAGYAVVRLDILSTYSENKGAEGYVNALIGNAQRIADACANLSS